MSKKLISLTPGAVFCLRLTIESYEVRFVIPTTNTTFFCL